MGFGFNSPVRCFGVHDDGPGRALYAGGDFLSSGVTPGHSVARWMGTDWVPIGPALQFGPYAMNSFDDGTGPKLYAAGSLGFDCAWRSPASCSAVYRRSPLVFFQGTTSVVGGAGSAFGDGLRCAGGNVTRLAIRSANAGVAEFGHGVALDPPLHEKGSIPLGLATRHNQAWYRDAQTFCTSATFHLTNGVTLRRIP